MTSFPFLKHTLIHHTNRTDRMNYCLAPMEGLTGYVYRQAHRRFYPGLTRYYTPFLSPVKDRALTTRDKNEVLPQHNAGIPLVPQILTRSIDDLLWGARLLGEMGYDEINLNLGCPSPTVTSKGKGAGFLREPDAIGELLDRFFSAGTGLRLGVKTRLGVEEPEDFECLLEVYNRFPLSELIVHPRVQKDQYVRPVRPEYALRALRESRAPVCYNGDLFCRADVDALSTRLPGLESCMLGRGLLANPGLLSPRADASRLRAFHEALLEGYAQQLSGDQNVLFRMKELWFYLRFSFVGHEKAVKRIKKTRSVAEYRAAVDALFETCPLDPSPCFIAPGCPRQPAP